jgi:hypothetical protein
MRSPQRTGASGPFRLAVPCSQCALIAPRAPTDAHNWQVPRAPNPTTPMVHGGSTARCTGGSNGQQAAALQLPEEAPRRSCSTSQAPALPQHATAASTTASGGVRNNGKMHWRPYSHHKNVAKPTPFRCNWTWAWASPRSAGLRERDGRSWHAAGAPECLLLVLPLQAATLQHAARLPPLLLLQHLQARALQRADATPGAAPPGVLLLLPPLHRGCRRPAGCPPFKPPRQRARPPRQRVLWPPRPRRGPLSTGSALLPALPCTLLGGSTTRSVSPQPVGWLTTRGLECPMRMTPGCVLVAKLCSKSGGLSSVVQSRTHRVGAMPRCQAAQLGGRAHPCTARRGSKPTSRWPAAGQGAT